MSDVQIYVIHHDGENYPTFESENIIPILAGNLCGMGTELPCVIPQAAAHYRPGATRSLQ